MSRFAHRELILSSQRLTLRPFASGDAADVFAAITPTLTRFMGWEPPASPAAFAQVWREWLPAMENATDFHFVVRSRRRGEFLGVAGLHGLKHGGHVASRRLVQSLGGFVVGSAGRPKFEQILYRVPAP